MEVRSPEDYGLKAEQAPAAKRADYFAAGTQIVWDVDAKAEVVRAYRASEPDHAVTFRRGDDANAEPALPGWAMPVDDLFAQ